MALPFFYTTGISGTDAVIGLDEDTSRHIVQVLRMKVGEQIRLTDGVGHGYVAEIIKEHKKSTEVKILSSEFQPRAEKQAAIAISPVKNANRFEWFLEKATELGINKIIPLLCERTEKQHLRLDRLKNILVSAMLQSQQTWLPLLLEPIPFNKFLATQQDGKKMIAHCMDGTKNDLSMAVRNQQSSLILIGPEGDFTAAEIEEALAKEYLPVSLGNTRLRTETAGVAAAVMMKLSD